MATASSIPLAYQKDKRMNRRLTKVTNKSYSGKGFFILLGHLEGALFNTSNVTRPKTVDHRRLLITFSFSVPYFFTASPISTPFWRRLSV